jgi:hypothetical protein
LLLYKVVLAKGLNTPTAPPDPGGALLWGLFRRIETLYGLVPVAGKATVSNPSRTTGAVTGELGFSVPAGLPLGYSVTAEPTQGSLTIVGMGYYTYTPDAGSHGGTDSFTVSASSVWAATTSTITVPVMVPATTVPAGTGLTSPAPATRSPATARCQWSIPPPTPWSRPSVTAGFRAG